MAVKFLLELKKALINTCVHPFFHGTVVIIIDHFLKTTKTIALKLKTLTNAHWKNLAEASS